MWRHSLRTPALALLLSVFAAAAHAAVPRVDARYLVLEVDANDAVSLVASKRVNIAVDSSVNRARAMPELAADAAEATLVANDGSVVAREVVALDRFLRSEHASEEGAIDGRWIAQDRTAFVVRLPATDAAFVDVKMTRSGRMRRFDAADVDRRARVQSEAAAPLVEVRGDSTNAANRVDLVILGDGYTLAEAPKFYRDAERIVGNFLSVEPYASYANFVNAATIFVSSAQSGADHPSCDDGGADPKEGTSVNTAFDAAFCTGGIQRLLTVNTSKVLALASSVPDWDKIVVIVNDDMYGGSGGVLSVASTHDRAVEVVQHEYGHSFSGLADEYTTPYPGHGGCSDAASPSGCEPNVTDQVARAKIKWAPFIAETTPLPTPEALTDAIGLFEGARYETKGMYRPQHDCLMNRLSVDFCAVCAQTYVMRLYTGWRGSPAGGIRLIEPGSESPAESELTTRRGQPVTMSAAVLQPVRGSTVAEWFVNGTRVEGATSPTYLFPADRAGEYVIELRVADTTPLVHPAMAGAALRATHRWTIRVTDQPAPRKRRSVRS